MRNLDEIHSMAAERHGGVAALEAKLDPALSPEALAAIPDDRWFSTFAKAIFSAGFNWKVVEAKWPGFEEAFDQFQIGPVAMINDDRFDALVADTRIIRNGAKIRAVQENAVFFSELAAEHGSAARAFAEWPDTDYAGLLEMLKKRGSRLGGTTAQYALRFMGRESYILSRDVVARLIAEGVIDKNPTSKKAMAQVQSAFNTWSDQSGRGLKDISRILAMSIG